MPKDVAFSLKTENILSQPVKEIKIESNVKNEQVVVKQENINIKYENTTPQKEIKSENEDEQNLKVDVTGSPTGYVSFIIL